MIRRQDLWLKQYHSRRYMEHLTDTELEDRFRDIFVNFLSLTTDAKIGLVGLSEGGARWGELFSHVMEEYALRCQSIPRLDMREGFASRIGVPDPRSPLAEKAAAAVREKNLHAGSYLVKYGKRSFLQSAVESGRIRISPASSYTDASLNHAVRDNELEFTITPNPREATLHIFSGKDGHYKGSGKPRRLSMTTRSKTDYYVYCLSSSLSPRLFLDFEADACLVIADPDDFVERVLCGLEAQCPDWSGVGMAVSYIDPLLCERRDIDVFNSKHFRYSYQKEFRLTWVPETPATSIDHVSLEIGSLKDSCLLISLG